MLIVGSVAAVTAVAVFFAWIFIKRLRALWRERRRERSLGRAATKVEGSDRERRSRTKSVMHAADRIHPSPHA